MKRPLFSTVQGTDFGRNSAAMKWARSWVNPIDEAIRKKLASQPKKP